MTDGRLEAIWIKTADKGPMDPADRVELVAGSGITGNADQGGKRQVTIIEQENWDRMMEMLSASLDPSARRANLMIKGLPLAEAEGRVLKIGRCRIQILGETRPCRQMDDALLGLREAMIPEWRGGVYGQVLDDGVISIGDSVEWEYDAS